MMKHDYETVKSLFQNKAEFLLWTEWIKNTDKKVQRTEFADYQTPSTLVNRIYDILDSKNITFSKIFEPTSGRGNFIIEGLKRYENVDKVIAIETQQSYINELKKRLIDGNFIGKVDFLIKHENFFKTDISKFITSNTLLIGNPPWITNSELGSLDSDNLPKKSNLKKRKGYDALTGKSNFDIAEFILMIIIDNINILNMVGEITLAFLVKNIVATNLLKTAKEIGWNITTFEIYNIDSKKEFGVSVEACLLLIRMNELSKGRALIAKEYSIYNPSTIIREYGWINDNFVSNVDEYNNIRDIEAINPEDGYFVWRSGIKHDASKIMELDYKDGKIISKSGENFISDEEYLYPLYKSSHIRKITSNFVPKKWVIVTQKDIKSDTKEIAKINPHVWNYLIDNQEKLNGRKSSIYKGKPRFSMFGVGDYSFKDFKVAISGMYKEPKFAIIPPFLDKPAMVDDTVYFLSTDSEDEAFILFGLLNHNLIQTFLKTIAFLGNKRPYTKDILQRIDLSAATNKISINSLNDVIREFGYTKEISEEKYQEFKEKISIGMLF